MNITQTRRKINMKKSDNEKKYCEYHKCMETMQECIDKEEVGYNVV